MTKVKVSIALATYNGEKYLLEQLRSFASQTYLPDELIIVDDRSTDQTILIVKAFMDEVAFKVRLFINDKNLGFAQNFSKALELCNGDIVFISDQDDVWLPNKIEIMLARFENKPELQLLVHDCAYCKADLTPIGQTAIERTKLEYDNLYASYVIGMATAVRLPFLRLCLPIPNDVAVTHDCWLHKCACAVQRKEIITDVLALYRRHSSNTSGKPNHKYILTSKQVASSRNPDRFKRKIPEINVLDEAMVMWLQNSRTSLVNDGYVENTWIDELINVENEKAIIVKARKKILSLPVFIRLPYVIKSYYQGLYRNYNNLFSAFKDLTIK